ncbi:SPW repeat domain-containing protein [Halovivax gelatinilyticus]|uniref:SPW repeat domain-containing protein n=1 Tax=Halovivax gelatinilyticus TaxID=2961597 RepID=UPI0020CA72D3|nr:SPW repeat protein [Halovivax gelatinilyticus]
MSDTPADTPPSGEPSTDRDPGRETGRARGLNTDVMQWVSALAAIVGLLIVASPFVYEGVTDTAYWNNTLVGTGIFVLAGYNFYRMTRDQLASVAAASLAVLLGLWIVVSPFAIDMGSDALATSTTVAGIAVVALSGYNAYANSRAETPERAGTRA